MVMEGTASAPWDIRGCLLWAKRKLSGAGVDEADREAALILAHVLSTDPADVKVRNGALDGGQRELVISLVEGRARGTPLPYLLCHTWFLDFSLVVHPGVFIPRPETEGLAELALALARDLPPGARVLDMGTGSGALALALARVRGDISVEAVDVSETALRCAWENAHRFGLSGRISFSRSDLFAEVRGRFHLIVSNPPYVPAERIASLQREVSTHEPRVALDGGEGGLEVLRRILREAPGYLEPGGHLLCEIGNGQGGELIRFAKLASNWVELRVERDIAGRERYLLARC